MVLRAPPTPLSLLKGTLLSPATSKAWLCPTSKIRAPSQHCPQDLGSGISFLNPAWEYQMSPPLSTAQFLSEEERSASSPSNPEHREPPRSRLHALPKSQQQSTAGSTSAVTKCPWQTQAGKFRDSGYHS